MFVPLRVRGARNKLVSAVVDGQRDDLCPLRSYQFLYDTGTQLQQSEHAMLRVTMNERTRRPNELRGECVAGRRTGGTSTAIVKCPKTQQL